MLKITLITLGNKMPPWVDTAVDEFCKRLREYVQLNLVPIALLKRGKSMSLPRILEKEKQLTQDAIPQGSYLIALDQHGASYTSSRLAQKMAQLQQITGHLCFLIGGPEGLSPELLHTCHEKWSLSQLTLPHPIARIVLLEALYRAYAIINHHPYHK